MAPPDYDVLVLGGGIQGAGVAQAATAAGHSVLVVEKSDVAAETSSRSSKLIHGGLRYLESGQLRLVRESLRERATLLRIAPHLVRMVPFFLPRYRGAARPPWQMWFGLSLYSALGGLRTDTRFRTLPRHRWDELEGLQLEGLEKVFRYHDGQTDDAALARAVMASAAELGAELWTGTELLHAKHDDHGVESILRRAGGERRVRSRVLVNAAGPWVGVVGQRIEPRPALPSIELVAGTHVEIEGETRPGIYYVEAPQDGRGVFVMPWRGHSLIGTTERPHEGDPDLLRATPVEVDYLRDTFERHFPDRAWKPIETWAGLRVLPAADGAAFHRSREVILLDEPRGRPRVLTVCGGKLTGYRVTAERVVKMLRASLPTPRRRADTETLRLPALAAGSSPTERSRPSPSRER